MDPANWVIASATREREVAVSQQRSRVERRFPEGHL
jgi:hypothetical protein